MQTTSELKQFVDKIPEPTSIKERLTENLREAKLLRQLLKISEQRQQVREDQRCKS